MRKFILVIAILLLVGRMAWANTQTPTTAPTAPPTAGPVPATAIPQVQEPATPAPPAPTPAPPKVIVQKEIKYITIDRTRYQVTRQVVRDERGHLKTYQEVKRWNPASCSYVDAKYGELETQIKRLKQHSIDQAKKERRERKRVQQIFLVLAGLLTGAILVYLLVGHHKTTPSVSAVPAPPTQNSQEKTETRQLLQALSGEGDGSAPVSLVKVGDYVSYYRGRAGRMGENTALSSSAGGINIDISGWKVGNATPIPGNGEINSFNATNQPPVSIKENSAKAEKSTEPPAPKNEQEEPFVFDLPPDCQGGCGRKTQVRYDGKGFFPYCSECYQSKYGDKKAAPTTAPEKKAEPLLSDEQKAGAAVPAETPPETPPATAAQAAASGKTTKKAGAKP